MADYGESKSQDKRLRAQGKPETVSGTQTFEEWWDSFDKDHRLLPDMDIAESTWNARQAEVDAANAKAAQLQASFDLRWAASRRAIKMWQEANPGNDHVWPDIAHLETWLMERIQALESSRDAYCVHIAELAGTLESLQQKAKP